MSPKGDSVKSKTPQELQAQRAAKAGERASVAPVKTRRQQLDDYKSVVVKRQRDFVELGTALGLIAKQELFKEDGYRSFEEFVEREFDMTRSYAYRLVDAARVISILSPMATPEEPGSKIKNESQARQLVPLGKDRAGMLAVLAAAEKRGGRLTAAALADARDELYPDKKIIDGDIVRAKPALVKGVRAAIEQAAEKTTNVGPGVVVALRPGEGVLCPLGVDHEHCQVCGKDIASPDQQGGYLRCRKCDPRQEHIALPTLDAQWGDCRLCTKVSATAIAETPPDPSLAGLVEPAGTDQAAVSAGTSTPEGGSSTFGPGSGPIPGGAHGRLSVDVAGSAAPEPAGDQEQERIEDGAADPPADSPAAAVTSLPDGDGDPTPDLSQQLGHNSPAGPDHPVAITVLPGIGHHPRWEPGGAPAVATTAAVEPGELEDGGAPPPEPSSSSDPDDAYDTAWNRLYETFDGGSRRHLIDLYVNLEGLLEQVDVAAIGPSLTGGELSEIHKAADRLAHLAELLGP